jgi:hypothetical protein
MSGMLHFARQRPQVVKRLQSALPTQTNTTQLRALSSQSKIKLGDAARVEEMSGLELSNYGACVGRPSFSSGRRGDGRISWGGARLTLTPL